MKKKLNINTRYGLLRILPESGSISEVRIAMKLRASLPLTDEEKKKSDFKSIGATFMWTESKDPMKEFNFNKEEMKFIYDSMSLADQKKDFPVSEELLNLYEEFEKEVNVKN